MITPAAKPEFSRVVDIDRIGEEGLTLKLEATAEERAALAERFDLQALNQLEAVAHLSLQPKGSVRAEIDWRGNAIQTCVVSLEPIEANLADKVVVIFSADVGNIDVGELEMDLEMQDPPEPLVENQFDLGETIAELFGVTLDPYPRRPEAEIPKKWVSPVESETKYRNPFAKLAELSEKK